MVWACRTAPLREKLRPSLYIISLYGTCTDSRQAFDVTHLGRSLTLTPVAQVLDSRNLDIFSPQRDVEPKRYLQFIDHTSLPANLPMQPLEFWVEIRVVKILLVGVLIEGPVPVPYRVVIELRQAFFFDQTVVEEEC